MILAVLGGGILLGAHPSTGSLARGAALVFSGLMGRLWAISWIGRDARTRDPGPPDVRVTGGPYRLRHPLYLSNIVLGAGLCVACRPSLTLLTLSLTALTTFYLALAVREERHLRHAAVEEGTRTRTQWFKAARAERSSWATAASVLGVLWLITIRN